MAAQLLAGFYYLISFYRAIIGLCTYFIVGALVMHFVYGAKGQDNIPNVNFWMDFPFLLRVSFLFETVMYQVVVVVDRMEFFYNQSLLQERISWRVQKCPILGLTFKLNLTRLGA